LLRSDPLAAVKDGRRASKGAARSRIASVGGTSYRRAIRLMFRESIARGRNPNTSKDFGKLGSFFLDNNQPDRYIRLKALGNPESLNSGSRGRAVVS
jgi:hypothetical protein